METQYSGETILLLFTDSTGPALLSCMIAGIPFNRVHELEFLPGELRMDVTKDSTLRLLKQREDNPATSSEYAQIIKLGRKELESMRSESSNVVNLKDQKMEAERIAIDKEYNQQQEEKRQQEALLELDRQRRLEETRRQQGDDDSMAGIPLAAFGAAGAVAIGGIFAASGGDKTTTTTVMDSETTVDMANNETEQLDSSLLEQEMDLSESGLQKNTSARSDPYEAAEKAMQEYLDRDDGAEDWLTVMSEIIEDDDDERMIEPTDASDGESSTQSFE